MSVFQNQFSKCGSKGECNHCPDILELTCPGQPQKPCIAKSFEHILVDVSDIFYFFLLGGGEGGVRGEREGGGRFFIENPGGVSQEGGRGGGAPGGCLPAGNLRGGGLNIFFRGRNSRQDMEPFPEWVAPLSDG